MNEVVKYHSNVNNVALRQFNKNELDILFAIMSRMREKGEDIVEFNFDYIKSLIKWEDTKSDSFYFVKLLKSTYKKLINTSITIGNERKWTEFVLFTKYTVDLDNKTVNVGVNTEFKWVLNELTNGLFTRFDLEEFVDLKSSYSKEFFRRMKQFKTTGVWNVSLEEFRILLDIPDTYRISDIDKKVLSPIKKELGKKYDLKFEKVYNKKKKGRPTVDRLIFYFKREELKDLGVDKNNIKQYDSDLKFNPGYYIYRTIRLRDTLFEQYNYLKVHSIRELEDKRILVTLINVDDNYKQIKEFENLKHWDNFFEKYVI